MNTNIECIYEVIEDIKVTITDNQYKIVMDNLMVLNRKKEEEVLSELDLEIKILTDLICYYSKNFLDDNRKTHLITHLTLLNRTNLYVRSDYILHSLTARINLKCFERMSYFIDNNYILTYKKDDNKITISEIARKYNDDNDEFNSLEILQHILKEVLKNIFCIKVVRSRVIGLKKIEN